MYTFQIETPKDLKEALELKWKFGAELHSLAGGTDVLVSIRNKRVDWGERPHLLNIRLLKELAFVKESKESIEIGPMMTHADLIRHPLVEKFVPTLSKALSYIGSPQIRNLGTISGNMCHASPAADSLPILYARDSKIEVSTLENKRLVPINEFLTGPGQIEIGAQEIVTKIIIPKLEGYTGDYLTLRQRNALSCNVVSVGIEMKEHDGTVEDIRIALGAVSQTVVRGTKTESFLRGKKLDKEVVLKACKMLPDECVPIDDVRSNREYRKAMTGVLLKKFLQRFLN
ncbi:MAG: FAD binding domain-containing protein [Candidatus Hodarchaeales archaeon]